MRNRAITWRAAAGASWALAGLVGVLEGRAALGIRYVGQDLWPLYGAGRAVLDGRQVYEVRNFVYPPSAAVASVPLTAFPVDGLVRAVVVLHVLAVAALAAGSVLLLVPRRADAPGAQRIALAGFAAAVVLGGLTVYRALPLVNVSVVVALVVLGVAWLWGSGRWGWGTALLAVSLLVKPLLVPLVVVPLLARRWRPPVAAALACLAVTVACLPLAGGPGRLLAVAEKLAGGSILVGAAARNNLSITGFATFHHVHGVQLARALVVLVVLGTCAVVAVRRRAWDAPRVAWLSAVLLAGTFLASRLSEVHFLLALVPGVVAVLARSPSRAARLLVAAGAALLCLPWWSVTLVVQQELSVAGQLLVLAGAVVATVRGALEHDGTDAAGAGAAGVEPEPALSR